MTDFILTKLHLFLIANERITYIQHSIYTSYIDMWCLGGGGGGY